MTVGIKIQQRERRTREAAEKNEVGRKERSNEAKSEGRGMAIGDEEGEERVRSSRRTT